MNIIVGGGICGIATALKLYEQGERDIVLLEKENLLWDNSGRSFGIVEGNSKSYEIYRKFASVKDMGEFFYVNPYEFSAKVFNTLRKFVRFNLFEEVVDFVRKGNEVVQVITSRSTYPCNKLFLCANKGNPKLLEILNIEVPYRKIPLRGIMLRGRITENKALFRNGVFIRSEGKDKLLAYTTQLDMDSMLLELVSLGYENFQLERKYEDYDVHFEAFGHLEGNVFLLSSFEGMGTSRALGRIFELSFKI